MRRFPRRKQNCSREYRSWNSSSANRTVTGGYAALALDGIWPALRICTMDRANTAGSADLGEETADNVLSSQRCLRPRNVGFVTIVSSRGGRVFSKFSTTLPGNENGGHNYGTMLPPKDRIALIEYLKGY
jgi:hypothetical protein